MTYAIKQIENLTQLMSTTPEGDKQYSTQL